MICSGVAYGLLVTRTFIIGVKIRIVHHVLQANIHPVVLSHLDCLEHNRSITKVLRFENLTSLLVGALRPLLFQVMGLDDPNVIGLKRNISDLICSR